MIRYKIINKSNDSAIVPSDSSYCTKYLKDTTLVDKKGIGFFCFKTKEQAQQYLSVISNHYYRIIKIQIFGRGFLPKKIAFNPLFNDLDNFYKYKLNTTYCIPKGTICYKKIKVLE